MFISLVLLAVESNEVIALRTIKLIFLDHDALWEVRLMIGEKVDAVFEATAGLICGATGSEIIEGYRRKVAANAHRLSSLQLRNSRSRG